MTSPDLSEQRRAVADQIFEMSDAPSPVIDFNGYEDDGAGTLTRVVFLADPQNPEGDSLKAGFGVSFAPGELTVIDVHGDMDASPWFRLHAPAEPAP